MREAWTYLVDELDDGLRSRYPSITPAQARIMTLLDDTSGVRMSVLAERAQLTKQSLTELVVALEESGLVERQPDPTDGRAKLVVPTKKGLRAMRDGLEVAVAIHERWTTLIGTSDMKVLMRTLGSLVTALRDERVASI